MLNLMIICLKYYITRRNINNIPGTVYFKTNNIKLEFDEVPPSWCIDGDEMEHNEKTFEIKINKDNYMLVPSKNASVLFQNQDDDIEMYN